MKPQTIVLIACVAEKRNYKCAAKDMYQGSLFPKWMEYAQSLNPDKIFILSGKYGLLALQQEIAPYDVNLDILPDEVVRAWAESVLLKLAQEADLQRDNFVIIANETYKKYLIHKLAHKKSSLL